MPFVLKHKHTSEIYTCPLINRYDIPYYGTKSWDELEEAADTYVAFLTERGLADSTADWEPYELDEHKLKMCNVKLNNNANKRIFLGANGTLETRMMS
ncbi:hypothetical protein [Paenibacillus sp. MBLB4367]|uniref:hypothetical protein n=1 Tax=Paenibacillus sp. MBLB4367 TaxID=3384767 RepID=UPI003907F940